MRYLILMVFVIWHTISFSQSSAIIFCVDGLDFANTVLNLNIPGQKNYLQKAINEMNLGVQDLEIISFEWDGDAKKTDLRLKDLRKVMRAYYERAQNLNKKFIVVSHSWGTFLSYMALSYESQVNNPIEPDLFVTLSSPLGTYFAADMSGYSHLSTWKKILTIDNKIIGFVHNWFNALKYGECNNCYPKAKKWINVWAWGDLISGPMKDYSSLVIDINVDEESVQSGKNKRSVSTTLKWHTYTKLLSTGDNESLIERIKNEICLVVNCSSSSTEELTLGFILDSSGSMAENDRYNMRKSAMKVIIDQLQGNEKVFIVDFDDAANWLNSSNWNNINKMFLKRDIDKIDSRGGTDIGRGLDEMKRAIQSAGVSGRKGIILLSDGLGSYNSQAEWFRLNNIPIYTISFIGEDNSKLLSDIAALTNGNYLKANSDNEIITAFSQFVNFLRGNAILTVYKSRISFGETLISSFFSGPYLRYLFATLVWRGSRIDLKLKSPDGKTYTSSSPDLEWTNGSNYTFVKIDNPVEGKWEVELYGADIPSGGEDFNLQVSGDSPHKINLEDKLLVSGQMQFNLSNSAGSNFSDIKSKIEVTTPKNRKEDISKTFSGDGFNYRPRDGQGNYNFEVNLTGKDNKGSVIQRYFARTILVGEGTASNIAPVKLIEGNYIYTDLGKNIGNFQGLECMIYSQNSSSLIATGYVTNVDENECVIEIQNFLSGEEIQVGDTVELDSSQWQQDY